MEQPVYYWDPVIAPSGATFYTGDAFPDWKGDLLVGSLQPGCARAPADRERPRGARGALPGGAAASASATCARARTARSTC